MHEAVTLRRLGNVGRIHELSPEKVVGDSATISVFLASVEPDVAQLRRAAELAVSLAMPPAGLGYR